MAMSEVFRQHLATFSHDNLIKLEGVYDAPQ
ncbi:MAG: hypothetical protein JWQ50_2368 [Caballeronia mineralivorans]|jgi:hypothetical protein|nr:hypothetical protein [Caballeronia mineralivorans]